jgi:hypothetical protein
MLWPPRCEVGQSQGFGDDIQVSFEGVRKWFALYELAD